MLLASSPGFANATAIAATLAGFLAALAWLGYLYR